MAQLFKLSKYFVNLNLQNRTLFSIHLQRCLISNTKQSIYQYNIINRDEQRLRYYSSQNRTVKDEKKQNEIIQDRKIIDLNKKPKLPIDQSKEGFIQDDPDTFGTLSRKTKTEHLVSNMPDEQDDVVSEDFVNDKEETREHNLEYAKRIDKHVQNNEIVKALKVLEVEMKSAGARPANYIYTLLIGACGRVGYTSKAFKLYNDMKKRGLKVTAATYTGLINACATCRDSQKAKEKIKALRNIMREKQYELNLANYNALVKAYGRHRELADSFSILDEMLENKVKPDQTTFNLLLQTCISDKVAGFRHALLVWNKMRSRRIPPNIFAFNLILRAARECGLGDEDGTKDVIYSLLSPENRAMLNLSFNTSNAMSNQTECVSFEKAISEDLPDLASSDDLIENRPNLISMNPNLGSLISIGEIKNPEDRLLLLGGLQGFLKEMNDTMVSPDMKTFTLLLDCIPSSVEAERQLLALIKETNVKLDTEFCNMLIKKRCYRSDYNKARDVLAMFQEHTLQPDLITYGCIALTCHDKNQAMKFVDESNRNGFRLNKEMLTGMLNRACHRIDLHYIMYVMELFVDYDIEPDDITLAKIVEFIRRTKRTIALRRKGEVLNIPNINERWFDSEFNRFLEFYNEWLRLITVEQKTHFEAQFKYDKRQSRPSRN